MLKLFFIYFIFTSFLFGANSTVVYVNGSYQCVYSVYFLKYYNDFTVGYQLAEGSKFSMWWTANTGTQLNDRPIYTDTKVFFNVPNCVVNSSHIDLFPSVNKYIFDNNITEWVYDNVAQNHPIINQIPKPYFDDYISKYTSNTNLDVYQLNLLYGLSGLICATFLLYRISQ